MKLTKQRGVPPLAKSFLTPMAKRSTLTADICRNFVSHLIRGDWVEGDKIPPERELCQQLNVGRASLREALKALEIMGMIETRKGEGTFVCHRSEFLSRPLLWAITGSNVVEGRELVEARRLIEVELAGLAADRASRDDLKEIGDQLDRMEANIDDAAVYQDADISFHLAVAHAAQNRILANALELIRNLMREWIQKSLAREGVAHEALKHHKRIFRAIARKNCAGARDAMRQHLELMATYLLNPQNQTAVDKLLVTELTGLCPSPTSMEERDGSA